MAKRLSRNFKKFATNYEFLHKLNEDETEGDLGINVHGKLLHMKYDFDQSDESYTFGAAIGSVLPDQRTKISEQIMGSEPTIGITERIMNDKLIVMGGRDNLARSTDADIQNGFMDDIARVGNYFKKLFKF